jgi:hypothetical protein
VVSLLVSQWAHFPPERPSDCVHTIRGTCKAWRATVDADIKQLTLTVPTASPGALAQHFPNVEHLDLSRYQRSSQEVFPVLQHLKLRWAFVAVWVAVLLQRRYLWRVACTVPPLHPEAHVTGFVKHSVTLASS